MIGSLGSITADPNSPELYAFLTLVGCAYYKAHASAFKHRSPVALYHSIPEALTYEIHITQWLEAIRQIVWQRADTESQTMLSTEALKLHWAQCIWVLEMWKQATHNTLALPGELSLLSLI